MAKAKLEISKDKDFFRAETPDAEWDVEQIEQDGITLLYDESEPQPAYLVITEDFTGPLPKNRIYQLVPLDTEVLHDVEFEEEEEPAG